MSSTDGYCSVASFADGELGTLLPENGRFVFTTTLHIDLMINIELPEAMKEVALLKQVVEDVQVPPVFFDNSSNQLYNTAPNTSDEGVVSDATTAADKLTKGIPKQPEKKQRRIAPTLVSPLTNDS